MTQPDEPGATGTAADPAPALEDDDEQPTVAVTEPDAVGSPTNPIRSYAQGEGEAPTTTSPPG